MNNIIQSYQEAYQENKNQFAQLSSEELLAFRKRALDLSEEVSWPNRKNENWKYAPLKALQEKKVSLDLEKKIRLMNVHSLVKKQKITDISDYPQLKKYFIPDSQDSIFTLFNHTLWQEACLFHIVNTQKTNEIVHLRLSSLSAENAEFIKLFFILEPETKLTVFLDYQDVAGFIHLKINTELKAGSQLTLINLAKASDTASIFIEHEVSQKTNSFFIDGSYALQSNFFRHNLKIDLQEPEARCELLGVALGKKEAYIEQQLMLAHNAPNCYSNQFYKSIAMEHAQIVFHSKVRVDALAHNTKAYQKNNNLLLSSNAEIDTKPELEIYNQEVQCSHGATVGTLDEQALFYLQARGIDLEQAKEIVMIAFINEILSQLTNLGLEPSLQEILQDCFTKKSVDEIKKDV